MQFTCRKGHSWEVSEKEFQKTGATTLVCPRCGAEPAQKKPYEYSPLFRVYIFTMLSGAATGLVVPLALVLPFRPAMRDFVEICKWFALPGVIVGFCMATIHLIYIQLNWRSSFIWAIPVAAAVDYFRATHFDGEFAIFLMPYIIVGLVTAKVANRW